ncbi:MAG: hypothetical protein V4760_04060 [Bdellovibrionota bacterium]
MRIRVFVGVVAISIGIASLLYVYGSASEFGMIAEISAEGPPNSVEAQLFTSSFGTYFVETESQVVRYASGDPQTLEFRFPSSKATALRLDPFNYSGKGRLLKLRLYHGAQIFGYDWDLGPNSKIEVTRAKLTRSEHGIDFESEGDPQIIFPNLEEPKATIRAKRIAFHSAFALVIALFQLGVVHFFRRRDRSFRRFLLNPYIFNSLAAIAVGSIAFMAFNVMRPSASTTSGLVALVDDDGNFLTVQHRGVKIVMDPFTVFRNFPGQKSFWYEIDQNGFRGGLRADDERPLVFLTGGSAAFSLFIAGEKNTLNAQIERYRPELKIVNAGIIAALSGQELALMVHHLDRHVPKAYVSYTGWNDLFGQITPRAGALLGFNHQIFSEYQRMFRLACKGCVKPKPLPMPADEAESRAEYSRLARELALNLSRMNDFAKARGAKYLAVLQPEICWKSKRTVDEQRMYEEFVGRKTEIGTGFKDAYRRFLDEAAVIAKSKGVDVLDLSRSVEFTESEERLFIDHVHLTERGAVVAGKLIADRLPKP